MYEAKYSKYVIKSKARFADVDEVIAVAEMLEKGKKSTACGVPLYYDAGKMYVDNSDAHYYIQGKTGCKKSRTSEINIINSIIAAGESMIVNDPKGEAYERTSGYAQAEGYKVQMINFRDLEKSDGWNPMSLPFGYYKNGQMPEAEQALNDLIDAIAGPSKATTKDIYWPDAAAMLLLGCSLLLMDSVSEANFNIGNLLQLTSQHNIKYLKSILKRIDPSTSAAHSLHGVVDLEAEKTVSCIYSTLQQMVKPFIQNTSLLNLLCQNEIDFAELESKKTVIYFVYPDEKTSLSFLVGLFFTQCYQQLISISSEYKGGILPRRINFVLDEFSNLPSVENFENRISEARGHNIRYFLFGQSFGQLENKYDKNAKTIIANCEWIVYPSKEMEFLSEIARLCGKEYDFYGNEHDLISPCDIQYLQKTFDGAEALILKSGLYPFVTKMPDYAYVDLFPIYPKVERDVCAEVEKPATITAEKWYNLLGIDYNYPFPIDGKRVDVLAKKSDSTDAGTTVE